MLYILSRPISIASAVYIECWEPFTEIPELHLKHNSDHLRCTVRPLAIVVPPHVRPLITNAGCKVLLPKVDYCCQNVG